MTRGPRYRALRDAVRADVGRAIAIASFACFAFALQEYISTVISYAGSTGFTVKLRLIAVVASLSALLWLPLLALVIAATLAPRLARYLTGRDALGPSPFAFPSPIRGARSGPPRMWAAIIVGLLGAAVIQRWVIWVGGHYKEKQLAAVAIAVVAVGLVPVVVLAHRGAARMFAWLARDLDPVFGRWSPVGRWRGALLAFLIMVLVGMYVTWELWPGAKSAWANLPIDQFQSFPPWRTVLPLAAMIYGAIRGSQLAALRGPRRGSRRTAAIAAATAAVVIPLTLFRWGADQETKYVAVTASPSLARVVDAIRSANDLDGDGFGSLLGENDCGPFDAAIRPGVRDKPDNGIDENCDGRDFSLRDLARPPGDSRPVPLAFRRPWNVLLLTVDTVRYDHTSFGGYKQTRQRDTTPRLAKLVEQSTWFTFANAPSAGTMASIPAIMTSKFFHSGIALDDSKKPPRLKPENTLIGEIMKTGGYTTGAITSHEYFNDWGMNQGMDTFDNEIGKQPDPFRITSSAVTDRAIAWISRQHGRKWFLWAHYIDPHGRYVPHPDGVSYGTTEEDLYDGELSYTDHHIGRLLDELARLPGGEDTVVIITSDHGDGFMEHGFINHGQALYRELLHVPLIISVPNNPPRKVGGAVSGLDIVPTIAELCGLDVSKLSFEGVSLVPQIFFGDEDPKRIVFAETNYPEPIRAAVDAGHKLIYRLKGNIYELYDLVKDPWEKTNLWPRDPNAGAVLREALDRWIERVLYSRDPVFNQAAAKIRDVLVATRPTPRAASPGVTFDGGKLAVLGVDLADPTKPAKPGTTVEMYFYFEALDTPSPTRTYLFQIVGWPAQSAGFSPTAPMTSAVLRSPARATLEGLFGTDRWRKGELVRDKLSLRIPADWKGDVAVGIGVYADRGEKVTVLGPHPGGDTAVTTLGVLPLQQLAPTPVPVAPPGPPGPPGGSPPPAHP